MRQLPKMTGLSLAVFTACAGMALPVAAQQAATPPDAAASAADKQSLETVTVTGFRRSLENALTLKRDADGFVDAISSDSLGRFPDLNVGEALSRIPGIQINREGNDRTATVNLRGLPSTFARVTLNGLSFADPAVGGGVPLGAFNSDVFTGFVVRKSPSAAETAGGLSGLIDLQIMGALSRPEGGSAKLAAEHNTLGSSTSPSLSASYNKRFGKDLAVFGALAYKKEQFRRDLAQPNTFQQLSQGNATFVRSVAGGGLPAVGTAGAAVSNLAAFADYYAAPGTVLGPGEVILNVPATNTLDGKPIVGTGLKSKYGVQFLNQAREGIRQTDGDLLTAALGAEWRATDKLTLSTTLFHTRRDIGETTQDLSIGNFGQGGTLVTADPNSLFTTPQGLNYVNNFSFINAATQSGRRSEASLNETTGATAGVTWRDGAWRLTTNGAVSKARGIFDQLVLAAQKNTGQITAANPVGNGSSGAYDGGYGDIGKWGYTLNNASFVVPGGTLNVGGFAPPVTPAQLGNVAVSDLQHIRGSTGDWIQFGGLYQLSQNKVATLSQHFERFFSDLPLSSVKFGISHEVNKFKAVTGVPSPWGVNPAGVTAALFGQAPEMGSYFGGAAPNANANRLFTVGDIGYALANLKPTEASLVPGQALTPNGYTVEMLPNGWVSNRGNSAYLTGNFTNDYTISSAYAVANIDTQLFDMPLRGNVGVRHEAFKKTISTLERTLSVAGGVNSASFAYRDFEKSYDRTLPSLMLALEPTNDIIVRYAAYETYVAPQRRDENPVTSVTRSVGAASTTYTVALGRKDLKPFTALSQDLGIEWYNRKGSVLAANYYTKKVKGYTYGINHSNAPEITCPANGVAFGTDYGVGALRPYDNALGTGTGCRAVNDDPANLINGQPAPVYVVATGAINNPNNIKVTGFELVAQQNLSFLPAPWSNFGGQANFSRTNIDGRLPNGQKVLLDGVSKDNYNLIGFYETKDFGVRLIFNHRTKYELPGGQTFTGNPRTAKARSQVDLSSTYNFGNGITVSFDAFNLTNALREDYDQDVRVLRVSNYDGRTYRLTARASF